MVVGKVVRDLRKKRGWSQIELAERTGMHRAHIGAIERGEKDIRMRTLCKLSRIFEITLSSLLKGTDDLTPSRKAKNLPQD